MAQLAERLTLAQVMISQFASSSPVMGSVLTAQSLEPASDSLSPSLSLSPSPAHTLSLSLRNTSTLKRIKTKQNKKRVSGNRKKQPGCKADPLGDPHASTFLELVQSEVIWTLVR